MIDPNHPLHATVLGYPRIGRRRELKRLVEGHWAGRVDDAQFAADTRALRAQVWQRLADAGLTSVPSNTFSAYDHVLDTTVMLGAIPDRFRGAAGTAPDSHDLATYFAMAHGAEGHDAGRIAPFEMTKWFDTNYHYLVPEIGPRTPIRADSRKPVGELREAAELGITTRPVLLGPVSYLLLAKPAVDAPTGFAPLERLDDVLAAYETILADLAEAGADWVQLDEPAFVADRDPARAAGELDALTRAYDRLGNAANRPQILAASYFGDLGPALPVLAATPVEAIGVDLHAGSGIASLAVVPKLQEKILVAGVVDGRNIWRTDLDGALGALGTALGLAGGVAVSTSCSLMHVPHDVEDETALDPRLKSWLAFADQKVAEVVLLSRALREGHDAVAPELATARAARADRAGAPGVQVPAVRDRLAALGSQDTRRGPADARAGAQRARLGLPTLPTTTIGSFPQTTEIRRARSELRTGAIDEATYTERMQVEVTRAIRLQEKLGIDVLVHGEPERNDMVQYFAENLDGFASTEQGWVQSYGSRCVRPPILWGDVSRPAPMTVTWASFAQRLTDRPVKGMLTGPTTILAWSFVRDDQPLADSARQVGLAIRDEVADLESAGIRIIQVDEPALRELLPLRRDDRQSYLDWAVAAFRLASSGISDATQIHTHLCYSEFGEILPAIDALDADVTSIEAARSRMELLGDLSESSFDRGIGPGVYDIHSPRIPTAAEITELLDAALQSVPADRLWVNPDCGLKTRRYDQVESALTAMVDATRTVRERLGAGRPV